MRRGTCASNIGGNLLLINLTQKQSVKHDKQTKKKSKIKRVN